MADHRAEQIMDAFTATVTGLATTGTNVVRDRVYPIGAGVDNGLSVYMGIDDPASRDDQSWNIHNSFLDIRIDMQVRLSSSTDISQQLNLIRKEIVVALQADPTLGLSFVVDLIEGIAAAPMEGVADQPIWLQAFNWTVHYERSRSDPSI